MGWTGRKSREIFRNIGKNTDTYRNIGDIYQTYRIYISLEYPTSLITMYIYKNITQSIENITTELLKLNLIIKIISHVKKI